MHATGILSEQRRSGQYGTAYFMICSSTPRVDFVSLHTWPDRLAPRVHQGRQDVSAQTAPDRRSATSRNETDSHFISSDSFLSDGESLLRFVWTLPWPTRQIHRRQYGLECRSLGMSVPTRQQRGQLPNLLLGAHRNR